MKKTILLVLTAIMFAIAGPTHYIKGEWYECDEYNYDSKGNEIHEKDSIGSETWYDYDSKDNRIHEKFSFGFEGWYKYNSKGNMIHVKWPDGYDYWYNWFGSKESGQVLKCSVN